MIGRVEHLDQRDDVTHEKAKHLDLSSILAMPTGNRRTKSIEQTHEIGDALDHDLISDAAPAIDRGEPVYIDREIDNTHRAVGAMLSNRISNEYGGEGLDDDTITIDFDGIAGQSFGAFLAGGVTMSLTGTTNDYVGKGLSGGKIIVNTPEEAPYEPEDNTLIGNVALYGATQGELYVNGMAGERFAVRNSGVKAVVESVGDHGCEYMTGGVVAVLGETGRNFAAGMSGGVAYVLDREGDFEARVNHGMVSTTRDLQDKDEQMLRRLVENHAAYTSSDRGEYILEHWDEELPKFVKVMPDAYAEIIEEKESEDVRQDLPATSTPTAPEDAAAIRGGAD
jgi:glutamate synthase (ferredoxin)